LQLCLAAFPHETVPVDVANIVRNNSDVSGVA
jgi:hypothetical protein